MAKLSLLAGTTSKILQVFVQDSSSTTGAGLAGLTNASAGLTAYYHRDTDTTATAISLVTMTVGTFTSSGFKEIDSTNMPGWYQLCPPNAALASGAKCVAIHLKGATNMAPLPIEIELTAVDNQDGVRFALTALPNAAAGGSGGLPTADANNSVKIQGNIKKNTALTKFAFLMTDSTNHNPKTGLGGTFTATRSIDGGAFAAGTLANPAEVANGIYNIDFAAADLNGNTIVLRVTGTGSDDTFVIINTYV